MRNTVSVWILAILAVVGGLYGGAWYASAHGMRLSTREPLGQPKELPEVAVASHTRPSTHVGVVVMMTPYGYLPSTATVRRGEVVEFHNSGHAAQRVMSDPHPMHDGNQELNTPGVVEPGTSWYTVMNATGTFSYHDEVYPSAGGQIIVR